MLNIVEKVNIAQAKLEYPNIIQDSRTFRNKKLVRLYYNKYAARFTYEQLLKRLKPNELIQTLGKPNYHERFYKSKLQTEATKFLDVEAEVSISINSDEESDTENRRELHHFKLKFKKIIQKELERNQSIRQSLLERIRVLEK